ncbi:tyrosine-type recombinase/integrase [Patescibacteria group bacterium]|nr:tyrosine-type recombinase/integrase [Patescibacteria group bacterium]MBU4512955.1 tyrosine-type recombinase/integrase [Patescibacteria group bacterium]MCG2692991.1 tyrosine-type recombinase/integrase [Candidatus Parcubacteria bacterium]
MQKSSKPIIKHILDFLEFCEVEKGLTQKSIENYKRFLDKFLNWLKNKKLQNLKPHELTDKHIWDYRVYLSRYIDPRTSSSLSRRTQNYYLVVLRVLLAYFADKDIESLPSDKIKLPKLRDSDKAIKFLTVEQIEKLLSVTDIKTKTGLRDRTIMEVLFSTGLRVSELTSLNQDQFNLSWIKKNAKSYELSITGKGGRTRTVYFSQRALYWLNKYLQKRIDNDKALFIHYHSPDKETKSHRLTPRSVARIVAKYTKMAGLPISATPHTLRHSFATDLLTRGADIRAVQEFLGHKNIVTTQVYTHVTNKRLRDLYDKFHSGNK